MFLLLLSIILILTQNVKSYIRDTNAFFSKLATLRSLPDDVMLCTIDVVSLSPNIPHDEGLIATRKTLDLQKDKRISTGSLIELVECILKSNIFEHSLSSYKQLRGTAVGTKMVAPYAIIFVGDFEQQFFSDCDISSLVWWRYIDDIFMLWHNGEKRLKKFLEILNCYHSTIKLTANYLKEKISFLDIGVIKKGNHLFTDLYIKPTDTHKYLHASCCHGFHSKKSIPYSQALRLSRICSEKSFFCERCNDLEIGLKRRG